MRTTATAAMLTVWSGFALAGTSAEDLSSRIEFGMSETEVNQVLSNAPSQMVTLTCGKAVGTPWRCTEAFYRLSQGDQLVAVVYQHVVNSVKVLPQSMWIER
jgi:hypothetical protein